MPLPNFTRHSKGGAVALTLIASMGLVLQGCDDGSSSAEIAKAPAQETPDPITVAVADEQAPAKPVEVLPDSSEEPVGPELVEGPRIVFDQTFHDFGIISDTLPVSFDFVFRNGGNEPLTIGDVRASCGCTAAAPTKDEYLPGEEGSIHVTFKPKGRTGHQAKNVRVNTNDPENKLISLKISCDILAAVNVEPKIFRFNDVEAGHTKTITGEIRVRGEDYKVTDIAVNGAYASAKILGVKDIEVSGMPATVTDVEITIHDDAPLGWFDRRVIIKTNNPEKPSLETQLWANVMGPIEIQPAKLPLGVVRAGQPFRRELRLVSRAGEMFKLTDWKIDSSYEGLEMKVEPAVEIPEEGVTILRLIVTGTGPEEIGKLEGNIVLSTNLDKGQEINVPFHCVVRPSK